MDSKGENKYQNGKIYKIVDVGYNKCHIGSTCENLSKRMSRHRSDYGTWLKGSKRHYTSVFDMFEEFGVKNCKIELIEKYICSDPWELRRQEGYHIQQHNCVNKYIAGRTQQESSKIYREQHHETINQQHICDCGGRFLHKHRAEHIRSKKHQEYLNQKI